MRYVGFLVSSLIGYVIGQYLLPGTAGAYAGSLISYHLYLGILIFLSDQKRGVALPIAQTIFTHLAFMMLVVGLPFARHYVPFFGIVRLFIPALAPFEVKWLFSQDAASEKPKVEEVTSIPANRRDKKSETTYSIEDLINSASAADHESFLEYLRQPKRTFSSPGRSVREEYGYWLADRARRIAAHAAAVAAPAAVSASANTAQGSQTQ